MKSKINPEQTHKSEWKKHNNKYEKRVRNKSLRKWNKKLEKGMVE